MATTLKDDVAHDADDFTLPPFLRRVRIRGYKSIAFCDVSLQPLTILVGRNAAGKSNFLDALAFLGDLLETGVAEAVKRHGNWSSLVCRSSPSHVVEIEVEAGFVCGPVRPSLRIEDESGPAATSGNPNSNFEGRRFVAKYVLEVSVGRQGAPSIRREQLDLTDEDGQQTGFDAYRGSAEPLPARRPGDAIGLVVSGSADVMHWRAGTPWGVILHKAAMSQLGLSFRDGKCLLESIGISPFVDLAERLKSMAFYNFHPDAMRSLQKPLLGSRLDRDGHNVASVIETFALMNPDVLKRAQEYLSTICEEVTTIERVAYGEYETVQFWLRAASGQPAHKFDAASMSDGTLRALAALVAAFQSQLPRGPSVIGIEEPETALHPAAMRALVDALDESTQHAQVLLTTHSADLLSGRDVIPGQVLVVRNRDGHTLITPVDQASREIVEKELYTLADLQRMDRLDLDEADLNRQSRLSNGTEGS